MARCVAIWGTFAQKVGDQFCQSIFSENNLAFLAYYFEATTKAIACVLPTVGVGRCEKMFEVWKGVGITCHANHMSSFESI